MDQIGLLSDDKLVANARFAIGRERKDGVEILRYFREIYERRLHLKYGYGSLFEMLMREFGYCNGSAQRRVSAVRLIIDLPLVEDKLESGLLTLTAVTQVQKFLQIETNYTEQQKLELIEFCEHKSTREIEKELVRRNPLSVRAEMVKAVDAQRSQLSVVIADHLLAKLDRLKSLLSHREVSFSYEKLFDYLADLGLKQLDPESKVRARVNSLSARVTKRESISKTRSRAIPAKIRREVWRRNAGRGCEFEALGKACGSKYQLQIDHRILFSEGGRHDIENLRMMCAQHNRWLYAEFQRQRQADQGSVQS